LFVGRAQAGVGLLGLGKAGLHGVEEGAFLEEDEQRAVGQVFKDGTGCFFGIGRRQVRDDPGRGQAADGALRARIEFPDRVDLVPEEFDADRVRAGEGVHVENAAAEGHLAGGLDELHALEAPGDEVGQELGGVDHHARAEHERFLADPVGWGNALDDRLGAGDEQAVEAFRQAAQHIGAFDQRSGVGDLLRIVGFLSGGRKT